MITDQLAKQVQLISIIQGHIHPYFSMVTNGALANMAGGLHLLSTTIWTGLRQTAVYDNDCNRYVFSTNGMTNEVNINLYRPTGLVFDELSSTVISASCLSSHKFSLASA